MEAGLKSIRRNDGRKYSRESIYRVLALIAVLCLFALVIAGCAERADSMEPKIFTAVQSCQVAEARKELSENPVSAQYVTQAGETLLMLAAKSGCAELAKLLLERGADVNAVDSEGGTATMRAAALPDAALLRLLIEHGADVRKVNDYGESAIWAAIGNNNVDGLKELIENGADVNETNFEGQTPIEAAKTMGYVEIYEVLKAAK